MNYMMNRNSDNVSSDIPQNFFIGNIEYFTIIILLLNFLVSVGLYLAKM